MRKHLKPAGFTPPANRVFGSEHRTVAFAELIATVTLVLSTLIAATAVSVGIARADVASSVIDNEFSLFAIALLLGLLFVGVGGLTMLSFPHHPRHRKTHG
jgi:heme/copper-type cytochrome/quinol oxidase subunit 3